MGTITYGSLFAYLRQLGFQDQSRTQFERVFEFHELGILLVFSMQNDVSEDRIARTADVLSAQMRLQQHGLLEGELDEIAANRIYEQ